MQKPQDRRDVVMESKPLMLRGIVKREGDYWASIILDFNIVGTGDSPEDAVALSLRMTKVYIEEGCVAGKSLASMKRPAAVSARATYLIARVLSRVLPGRERRSQDETMPFMRPVLVACLA
jgi:hypothetical protein